MDVACGNEPVAGTKREGKGGYLSTREFLLNWHELFVNNYVCVRVDILQSEHCRLSSDCFLACSLQWMVPKI